MKSSSTSGWILSSNLSLFCIVYVVTNCSVICGFRTYICSNSTLTTGSGKLFSTNFPENYRDNENCWLKLSPSKANVIEISFRSFYTESLSDLNYMNTMCTSDYLEMSSSGQSLRICGNWRGREHLLYFVIRSSDVYIRFHSNEQGAKPGFLLQWTSKFISTSVLSDNCSMSLFETETSCYELIEEPEDWVSGHNSCRQRGAMLARIDHPDIHQTLEKYILQR